MIACGEDDFTWDAHLDQRADAIGLDERLAVRTALIRTVPDLADMGLTRLDAFNETQKPFWKA